MKNRSYFPLSILLSIIITLIAYPCLAEKRDQYDFRKVSWGMSIEEVKKSERRRVVAQSENSLTYQIRISDKNFGLEYQFIKNKLVRAIYSLSEKYLNEYKYILDYEAFKQILIKKYGPPIQDEYKWNKGDYFKSDKTQWGTAVSLGRLACLTAWENESTRIAQILSGLNYQVSYLIEYKSKQFEYLYDITGDSEGEDTDADTPIVDPNLKDILDNF